MSAIIRVTIKEAMRKRTFLIMSIVTVLYLGIYVVALYFFKQNMTGSQDMIVNMGAELVSTAGINFSQSILIFLTVMLGSGAISVDVDSGLIHGILSRPLSRPAYITGKLLGLLTLSGIFGIVLYMMVLGIGWYFDFAIVKQLEVGQIFTGLAYYLLAPAALLSLTVFLSIRLKTISNGILALFVFILGSVGGTVEQVGKMIENNNLEMVGFIINLISPFSVTANKAIGELMSSKNMFSEVLDAFSGMGSGLPDHWMIVFTSGYALLFYVLSMFLFEKKDIR